MSRKPTPPVKRLVWRISEAAPLGEFVDPDAVRRPLPRPDSDSLEVSTTGGWVVSSYELLAGTDVTEGPDTVPADLFDELFPAPVPPDLAKPAR